MEQVERAVLRGVEVLPTTTWSKKWRKWADGWLSGQDRTAKSAGDAAEAVNVAFHSDKAYKASGGHPYTQRGETSVGINTILAAYYVALCTTSAAGHAADEVDLANLANTQDDAIYQNKHAAEENAKHWVVKQVANALANADVVSA
jgi:hypothetical protein